MVQKLCRRPKHRAACDGSPAVHDRHKRMHRTLWRPGIVCTGKASRPASGFLCGQFPNSSRNAAFKAVQVTLTVRKG